MTTPVLICDDSSLARKQMARALPQGWDADISFAGNGVEGLEAIKSGKGEIVFLDLNMPELDGYGVLQAIRNQDLPAMVIVVSGDIQPEARQRVMALGAMAFIKKPVNAEEIAEILEKFGIRGEPTGVPTEIETDVDLRDCYQEIANVAMGRAIDLLARLLDVFVHMPIPNVNMIEITDLRMTLAQVSEDDTVSAVCQGFIGSGIAGEALLIFNEASYSDFAELMKYEGEIDDTVELELLMDISSVLIGACLNGIADQLDISFSQGHPVVLGQHIKMRDLLKAESSHWTKTLSIEMGYTIENRDISCDLLLLFTEDSIDRFNELASYAVD